eukprot:scaffold149633_cov35-Prasinocladus_malaysianus.AAC.1
MHTKALPWSAVMASPKLGLYRTQETLEAWAPLVLLMTDRSGQQVTSTSNRILCSLNGNTVAPSQAVTSDLLWLHRCHCIDNAKAEAKANLQMCKAAKPSV